LYIYNHTLSRERCILSTLYNVASLSKHGDQCGGIQGFNCIQILGRLSRW
jgi:hypothetical protein